MSIKYQIWFTWNAEREKIRLPVLPEKFSIKNGSNNQSIDLTGLGEITIMQSRPALQFSFSSFFPAGYFPGIKSIIAVPPILYIRMIERWKKSKVPIHFISTGNYINLYCTIESFNYSESGGDVGTFSYDITLKEYREVSLKAVSVDSSLIATVRTPRPALTTRPPQRPTRSKRVTACTTSQSLSMATVQSIPASTPQTSP